MGRADRSGVSYPTSVTLSTASLDGVVSARTVLLKGFDERQLVFESETFSRKGVELAENPHAAMTLYWREVHRQICVTGTAAPLEQSVSDEMWSKRGRPNQAASAVTHEGATISSLEDERALAQAADRLAASTKPIPRPESYQAYGLVPTTIEFWEGSADRLHRRVFYERTPDTSTWTWRRIQP